MNLIELPILKYDIILGMNWLSNHQASIDCHRKVEFRPESLDHFVY